jgi:hypothetical protein
MRKKIKMKVNEDTTLAGVTTENLAAETDGQSCVAGPELDELIAERVMGFRWFHCVAGTGAERNQFCSKEQEETWRGVGWTMTLILSPPPITEFNDASGCPRYSTDIAAAMEVVEKLKAANWQTEISDGENEAWSVFFTLWNDTGEYPSAAVGSGTSPTLAEAICRAALDAINDQATNTTASAGTTE